MFYRKVVNRSRTDSAPEAGDNLVVITLLNSDSSACR